MILDRASHARRARGDASAVTRAVTRGADGAARTADGGRRTADGARSMADAFGFEAHANSLLARPREIEAASATQERAVVVMDAACDDARRAIEAVDAAEGEAEAEARREVVALARDIARDCAAASAALARAKRALVEAGVLDARALEPFDPDA